jgi:filamentous hemagglutinin
VIDKFANGVATSIKSIDLHAPSYQDPATLARTINRYVDSVAAFKEAARQGYVIKSTDVVARELQLAIPSGSMSTAQRAAINTATARAQGLGVRVLVTPVP